MNPFPSVDYAHNMIIHEEGHCVVARDQDVWDEVVTFAAQVPNKHTIIFTVCNKFGNSSLECF